MFVPASRCSSSKFPIPRFGFAGCFGIAGLVALVAHGRIRAARRGFALPPGPISNAHLENRAPLAAPARALLLAAPAAQTVFGRLTLTAATAAAEGYVAGPDTAALVGRTGVALSSLRPSGTARFGHERLDVVAGGEFIEAGAPVEVVEAHGLRIVVRKTRGASA
jgi:membrane-bound serine protease (ClpP class)